MAMPTIHENDSWNKKGEFIKAGSGHLTKYGKSEIERLFFKGKGPLSIAVKLGLTHKKVKGYLKEQGLHEPEEYIVKGLSEQWVGT